MALADPALIRPSIARDLGITRPIVVEREREIDALAARHIAALDLAASQADDKWVLEQVRHYRANVNWYATHGRATALGGLGDNGIGPAIADTCRLAARLGKRELV